MKQWMNRVVCVLIIVSMTGCSLVVPDSGGDLNDVDDAELKRVVSRVIDEEWDHIADYIEDLPPTTRAVNGAVDSERIIAETMAEEHGRDYLEFCYSVASGADVDIVLQKAKALLSAEEYADLLQKTERTRSLIYHTYGTRLFDIDEENQDDFYKDLEKLVVSSTVLLTASVVYAAMPHIFFWGKITALAAVSVSAGVVAGTVMSIYTWYTSDEDYVDAFEDWLKMITEEPYAAYLLATSVISLGQSMGLSPVSCSVILGVFAMFNALNILRDMLNTYGDSEEAT